MASRTGPRPGDRGYAHKSVFEHNTRRGVGSVFLWRKPRYDIQREQFDTEKFDRHGIPRCNHCGGPGYTRGEGLGLAFTDGQPRIRFICQIGYTSECKDKVQSVNCSHEWRLLVPIDRLTETYHALRRSHNNYERIFRHGRERYEYAGNELCIRPKLRRCVPAQNLRGAATLLLDWFRVCLRHGWLGNHKNRSTEQPVRRNDKGAIERLRQTRQKLGLNRSYGVMAVFAGAAEVPEPIRADDPGGGR